MYLLKRKTKNNTANIYCVFFVRSKKKEKLNFLELSIFFKDKYKTRKKTNNLIYNICHIRKYFKYLYLLLFEFKQTPRIEGMTVISFPLCKSRRHIERLIIYFKY